MNALLIIAHPNPMSFDAGLAKVVQEEVEKKGAQIRVKDLYAMNFNPVLSQSEFQGFHTGNIPEDIQKEQEDVSWADAVIVVAPVWWNAFPAILKGYFDRVFSLGFAYEYNASGPHGKLTGKKALVITTSGADEKASQEGGMMNAIKTACVDVIFGFSGFAAFQHKNLFAVPKVSDAERKQMITDIRELVKNFI